MASLTLPFGSLLNISVKKFVKHVPLLLELVKRDFTERYHGQLFGLAWMLFHPLFLILLYTTVFAFVLGSKANLGHPENYAFYIVASMVPWLSFSENLGKSCMALLNNASLIKQVIFPIEVLPLVSSLGVIVTQTIFTILLMVYAIIEGLGPSLTWLLIPFFMIAQFIGLSGVAYLLSSLCVFIKDFKDLVMLFSMAAMYSMPIFFHPQNVPHPFNRIIHFNPLSSGIYCFQDIFYYREIAHPIAWFVFPALCGAAYVVGVYVFRKVKPQLGNLL